MQALAWDHVHYRCRNPAEVADWFEQVWGAEVVRDTYPEGTLYPGQARFLVRLGGQKILLAPPHPDHPPAEEHGFPYYGLEHIGFTVSDVDAAAAALAARGGDVCIGPLTRSPGLRLCFLRGPMGIMVELVQKP